MNSTSHRHPSPKTITLDSLPTDIPDGSAILVAKPASLLEHSLPLQITNRYAKPGDRRVVLTTTVDAERTIEQHLALSRGSPDERVGVVDVSGEDHPSAPFQKNPTVSLPDPSELTRIVMALWELGSTLSKRGSATHVVVRSLTPMLEAERLARVARVVEQLVERQRSVGGVAVFGIEYTSHDDRTMVELSEIVDGVVWVEETSDGQLRFDLQRSRNR